MNENWYEINYWDLDGEWRGCPNCNECDGEIPENDVHFYIDDFENKKKLNLFKKEIICFGRELLRQFVTKKPDISVSSEEFINKILIYLYIENKPSYGTYLDKIINSQTTN